eukprot:TRINITY_DN4023_c0_g3_i1.p1 TRINITY_DN4023_c0_g3~~TRINITY_DN4023_c0_g3_i1.p1  ORF type:complete len:560 (-),score=111.79 TRINITY_DN4023_c0_g3_i1:178-1857(-)
MKEFVDVRLGIVGDISCGKSSFAVSWYTGEFTDDKITWEDCYRKQIQVDGEDLRVEIYDAMNSQYTEFSDGYLHNAMNRWLISPHGFLMAFDVTNRESFNRMNAVREWIAIRRDTDFKNNMNLPIFILALKCDDVANRKVTAEEIKQLADEWGTSFIEVSAKTRKNIEEAVLPIVRWVLMRMKIVLKIGGKKIVDLYPDRYEMFKYWPELKTKDEVDPELFQILSDPSIVVSSSSFISDLKAMMEDEQFADASFQTSDGIIIPVHRFMLYCRGFFLSELENHHQQNKGEPYVLENIPSKECHDLLTWIYTDNLPLDSSLDYIVEVLRKVNQNQHPSKEKLITKNEEGVPALNLQLRRSFMSSSSDVKAYDVTFVMASDQNKPVKANKAILKARSPYFKAMLSGATKESSEDVITISGVSQHMFSSLLEYLYSDNVRHLNEKIATELLSCSGQFLAGRLGEIVQAYLLPIIDTESAVQVYKLCCEIESASQLRKYCRLLLIKWARILSNTQDWRNMLSAEESKQFVKEHDSWDGWRVLATLDETKSIYQAKKNSGKCSIQ